MREAEVREKDSATRRIMSRRAVCGVVRQEEKADWQEFAAWVACEGEAEEAWWTGLLDEDWGMGIVVGVWIGVFEIQRGMGEGEDMVKVFRWLG